MVTPISEFDSEIDLVACVGNESMKMPPEERRSEGLSREQVLEKCKKELNLSNQRLLFKLSEYTEDDVDNENVGQEEAQLRELYEDHVVIAVDIRNMMTEFEEILGETKRKQWYEVIAHQSKKVKHHSKEIRAKARQIVHRSAVSSYESV